MHRLWIVRELVANVSALVVLCTIAAFDRIAYAVGVPAIRRWRKDRRGRRLYYWREPDRNGA